MDEMEALALAAAAKKRRGSQQPKSFGQSLWENIVGDDDDTTQNTGEKIGTFLNKAGESMTLGLVGDEASGAVAGMIPGGRNFEERRDFERQQERLLEESNPGAAMIAEIGGAVLPALATAGLASAPTMAGTMLRGGALGAIEGGIYGAAEGEGGASGRAQNAGKLAAIGAAGGAAAPPIMRGVSAATRGVVDPIMSAVNAGNRGRANKAMAATLRESGQSVDDLGRSVSRAARQGQPEFRTMDALGAPGQRRANGIVRGGGEASEQLRDLLQQRQLDQGPRVSRFADEAFGLNGRTGNQITETLTQARGEAADAAFDAARGNAAPVDVRGALAVIDDRLGPMQGGGVADDAIGGKLSRFRNRLAAKAPSGTKFAPADSVELSDFDRVLGVKRDIQDEIGAAVRAGRNNEARELTKLVRELDTALEGASPQYRAANDGFREASRVIDAVDEGRGMARPSTRADDNVARFNQMTPEQQGTARAGFGDEVLKRIERNKSPTANRAKEVFGSTKAQTEANAMATDPRLLAERMGRENTMWDTQNMALGGSRTADNLADQNSVGQAAGGLAQAARNVANLQFGDAIANTGRALGPVLSGQNEATKKLIADALMSDDPVKAIGRAAISDQRKMALQLVLEGLVRGGGVRALER